jgi:hypothetical protein
VGETDGQDRLRILIERQGTHMASQPGVPGGYILKDIPGLCYAVKLRKEVQANDPVCASIDLSK